MATPREGRLACLSVDLDEVGCYAAIHGLGERVPAAAEHAIYDRAVPRFQDLFAEIAVPATFFVIGRDLEREENARRVRALHNDGHEIGNHTYDHFYDFSRRAPDEMREQVSRGIARILDVTGEYPRGFRAPGYTVNDAVFRVLEELDVAYDSSVFPCPAYYSAKAAVIGLLGLRGRPSQSIVDDPRVLRAPADPYRVGVPYWSRGAGTLELPIGVTRTASGRLPFIGTSVVLAGPRGAAALAKLAVGRPLVNLELHGMDLADAEKDELGFLAPHQPDLRRTVADKRAALVSAVEALRSHGYRFVTLAEAADHFHAGA